MLCIGSEAVLGCDSTPPHQDIHVPQTPSLTQSYIECSTTQEVYVVPWHKLPSNLMLVLSEKKRPKPSERRELIRIVIDDLLHKENGRPGRAKLWHVAKQIVDKYPCSFQDRELNGTKVIGTGFDALFIHLENRVENVRRPLTISAKRPAEDGDVVWKKSTHSDRYGCVEWQPAIEGRDELKSKQDELKRAFTSRDLRESCIRKMMSETYCIQRATINKGNIVKTVKEEWPFLFEAVHLFDHTCSLLGFPMQMKLPEELTKKKEIPSKTSLIQKG